MSCLHFAKDTFGLLLWSPSGSLCHCMFTEGRSRAKFTHGFNLLCTSVAKLTFEIILFQLCLLFYSPIADSYILRNVGPWNQSHGVHSRHHRRLGVHGDRHTCGTRAGLLGVRHSPAVALLSVRCGHRGQCRRLLAARHHTPYQEAHSGIQGADLLYIFMLNAVSNSPASYAS